MSSQITRRDVDWTRASCQGIDTDLFYLMRSELKEIHLSYNQLRQVCFRCPIQKECLAIASKMERYGFWGGLDEFERTYLYEGRKGLVTTRLQRDLIALGKSYAELEAIVLSVERLFGEFDRL